MSKIHYTACPVCNSEILHPVFKVKDYTVSKQEFEILHCDSCTARFTQDVPEQNAIGDFYKSDDYISHTNKGKGVINSLYKKVRVRTLKQKALLVKKFTGKTSGTLLDVGSGAGAFLDTMRKNSWVVTGLEPDIDARTVCKLTYGIEARPSQDLFELNPENFDAITLWHVLEHIHSLHDYLEQLRKLLRREGKLFIAVPNYSSKDAKVYGKYWAGYDVPRHLYHFTPMAMQQLLRQHGLRIIKMLPMWYDSFYVDLLSSKYKSGKTNFISAGLHGLASNLNAIGKVEECCSVIYVIEKDEK